MEVDHKRTIQMMLEANRQCLVDLRQIVENHAKFEEADPALSDFNSYLSTIPPWRSVSAMIGVSHLVVVFEEVRSLHNDKGIQQRLEQINNEFPDLVVIRNIFVHWNDYMRGNGYYQDGTKKHEFRENPLPNTAFTYSWGKEFILGFLNGDKGPDFRVRLDRLLVQLEDTFAYCFKYLS